LAARVGHGPSSDGLNGRDIVEVLRPPSLSLQGNEGFGGGATEHIASGIFGASMICEP